MANKRQKDLFNKLKKLKPKERVQEAMNPEYGARLLSLLTPTQYAELFPKHLQPGIPDVTGFREAITKKTQKEQQEYFDDVDKRLGSTSPGARERLQGGGKLKGSYSAANYVGLLKQAGFSDKDATLMAAVGMQESNGNVGARNDTNPNRERSYGLFQVNINAHKFGSPEMEYAGVKSIQDLYDPIKNAKVAYYLYYKGGGIRHWGGYTDGGYKKYLSAAEAAGGTPAGIPSTSGTQNFDSVSSKSEKSGGFFGGGQECVDLSKHFAGLGPASKWTFNHDAKIVAGSVIATTNYGNGNGGRHAADMPDKKSHYHTGIALTSPNANGDVLILEQFQGQPAQIGRAHV